VTNNVWIEDIDFNDHVKVDGARKRKRQMEKDEFNHTETNF
jgi:hypothetical protein